MSTLLLRFVVTASLARIVSEGLPLALVLLALDRSGSSAAAGWLVAITALPQLVTGPLVGPVLDRSAHPWLVLRVAGLATAAAAVLMVVSVGRWPFAWPAAAAVGMAVAQPLLTGGISATGARGPWSTRVFAWDSLAYNIAGLAGPALVTVVAVAASPAWALAALGGSCGAVAVTSLGLTVAAGPRRAPDPRPVRAAVGVIVASPPLRAATASTTLAFAGIGGLSFAVVSATQALGRPAADAGIVLTVSAVGGLVGSLAMTRRPAPTQPARTVLVSVAAMGSVMALMGLVPWPGLLAGAAVIGAIDGPLLVGLFTARTDNSPLDLRTTVFTVAASAKLGAASIGAVVAGQLLAGRSTGAGLVIIGLVHLAAAAVGRLVSVRISVARATNIRTET